MAYCKNHIGYFFSYTSRICIKIQLQNFCIEIVDNESEWRISAKKGEEFTFSFANEEDLYFISNLDRLAIVNENDTRILTLKIDLDSIKHHMTKRITCRENNEIITEYDMETDLDMLLKNMEHHESEKCEKHYGAKIYNYLKDL